MKQSGSRAAAGPRVPDTLKIATQSVPLAPVMPYRLPLERPTNLHLKRTVDITIASLGILFLFFPASLFIVVAILLDSKGPVFFRQRRSGRDGEVFTCIKFRTMLTNKEADVRPSGPGDDRITRTGRILRATHLDELPQLLNILLGQMSLVGPRPHMLSDDSRYEMFSTSYTYRQKIKPGLTGLAQVNGLVGHSDNAEEIAERVRNDIYYINHWSLWLDTKILLRTLVLFKKSRLAPLQHKPRKR